MLSFDANIDYTEVTPRPHWEGAGRRGGQGLGWDDNKSTFGRQSVSRKLKHFTWPDVDKLEPSRAAGWQ